jgi:FkbM family methyltransferase
MNRLARRATRARQHLGERLTQPVPEIPFSAAVPFLPDDPVIIEAGASTGMDLADLLHVWPAATVHAFEPEPGAYSELRARAATLDGVHTWPLALGRENGDITLNVSHGTNGTLSSSLLEPTITLEAHPGDTFDQVRVQQQTLSSWAAANTIERVDFLALDMQGFEHAALDASRDILRRASVVLSETFLVPMYEGAATVDQLQALLSSEGFVILETRVYWARTFALLAVHRDALERAIFTGRLPTRGSAGSLG